MKKTHILFLFFLAAACAINPVSGKRELSLIPENQEIALGQQTDQEIRRQYGVYTDPSLNEYIQSLGMLLTPHTHRPHLNYQFAVLDTPVVNAFAVPGGYIYVTRGILALMSSEAELAVVLGHELGHVNARHSLRRMSEKLLVQIGLALGSAISETFAEISGVASVGIQLLFLKYSRDDERQADLLGVEYSRKASFNPAEMAVFFSSLQNLGDLSGGHPLPGFLSTHPLTRERIQNVRKLVLETDGQLMTNANPYLRRVENMVFGDDPRQGFVEGNFFYHPQLEFSFSFPPDWKVQNTPSQVVLLSKDEKAAIVLQAEKSAEELPDFAQKKASNLEGRQYISDQKTVINGFPSYHQVYDLVRQDQENLRVRLSFIKKGPFIFQLSSLSTASDFSQYDSLFQATVGSFRVLSDPALLGRKPNRLRLVKGNGSETLQGIFQRAGMEKDLWPKAAILNKMELEEIPRPDRLIKVIK